MCGGGTITYEIHCGSEIKPKCKGFLCDSYIVFLVRWGVSTEMGSPVLAPHTLSQTRLVMSQANMIVHVSLSNLPR